MMKDQKQGVRKIINLLKALVINGVKTKIATTTPFCQGRIIQVRLSMNKKTLMKVAMVLMKPEPLS